MSINLLFLGKLRDYIYLFFIFSFLAGHLGIMLLIVHVIIKETYLWFNKNYKPVPMPELPDVEVFSRNLNEIFAGKKLTGVKIINGNKLQNTASEWRKALTGKILKRIYRSGKEMRFKFTGNVLVGLHLMLTGNLFVFEKLNEHHSTIAEFNFAGGKRLALTDRMGNATIKLNPVDKAGVDAVSKELNFKYLKKAFQRKTTIKKLLIDQTLYVVLAIVILMRFYGLPEFRLTRLPKLYQM